MTIGNTCWDGESFPSFDKSAHFSSTVHALYGFTKRDYRGLSIGFTSTLPTDISECKSVKRRACSKFVPHVKVADGKNRLYSLPA
jgi:hypothetical protein